MSSLSFSAFSEKPHYNGLDLATLGFSEGSIAYLSKAKADPERVNNNCLVSLNGGLLECRHFAWSFLKQHSLKISAAEDDLESPLKKAYRRVFRDQDAMAKDESLLHQTWDLDKICEKADFYFQVNHSDDSSPDSLGRVLEKLAAKFPTSLEKINANFIFYSEKHAMAFKLGLKTTPAGNLCYSVVFYDPNWTLSHVRFRLNKISVKIYIMSVANNQ